MNPLIAVHPLIAKSYTPTRVGIDNYAFGRLSINTTSIINNSTDTLNCDHISHYHNHSECNHHEYMPNTCTTQHDSDLYHNHHHNHAHNHSDCNSTHPYEYGSNINTIQNECDLSNNHHNHSHGDFNHYHQLETFGFDGNGWVGIDQIACHFESNLFSVDNIY